MKSMPDTTEPGDPCRRFPGERPDDHPSHYRSSNSSISSTDTEVGTDSVGGLAAGARRNETISLTAPSSGGTYYYGVCVDSASGESRTSNNCSDGVQVDVTDDGDDDDGGSSDGYCRDDDEIAPSGDCSIRHERDVQC